MQKSIIYRTLINIFLAAAEKIRKNILIFSMFFLYYFAELWTIWSDLKQLNLVQARRRWFFGFYVLFERLVVQKSIIFYRNWPRNLQNISILYFWFYLIDWWCIDCFLLQTDLNLRRPKNKTKNGVCFLFFDVFCFFCVLCFVHSSKLWSLEQIWSRT